MFQLEELFKKVMDEFRAFAKAFGEKESSKPEEMFGYILRFIQDLLLAHKVRSFVCLFVRLVGCVRDALAGI